VAVPLLALLACELDLALTAGAIGLGLRRSHPLLTFLSTGVISIGFVAAVFVIWILWFVAPTCVTGEGACLDQAQLDGASGYVGLGAAAQWAWMLGIALAVRRIRRPSVSRPIAAG